MQKAIRVGILVAVIVFLGALVVFNTVNPTPPDMTVWNEQMTKGDAATAKHHFIMYTDIFCPYCDKFSDAVAANMEHFDQHYIIDKNILFEIRVTDVNYENGHSENSRPAAVAAYCAAKQGDFWTYYYSLLANIYEDYHSRGIGVDRNSEKIPALELSYFYNIANDIESLNYEQMKQCVENNETLDEVVKNTAEAQKKINGGVPRFVFDKYTADGFAGNWNTNNDYKQVELLMEAGLASK